MDTFKRWYLRHGVVQVLLGSTFFNYDTKYDMYDEKGHMFWQTVIFLVFNWSMILFIIIPGGIELFKTWVIA